MAEEIVNNGNPTDEANTNDAAKGADYYIDAIQKLKENSVSKEAYEKKEAENKMLIDTLVNGGSIDMKPEEKVDIDALGKKLLNEGDQMTNLDYISNSLKLREAILANGGEDPFLPWGQKIAPTVDDIECANRVAEAFQSCVEYADGDPDIFTSELQRITIDTAPQMTGRGRR